MRVHFTTFKKCSNDLVAATNNTVKYNTIQYNAILYNTIQYNTMQYNTLFVTRLTKI